MSPDRSERERRLMASITERDEAIQARARVRENARRRNLARAERYGIVRRESGNAAVLLLVSLPALLLAVWFVAQIVGSVMPLVSNVQ